MKLLTFTKKSCACASQKRLGVWEEDRVIDLEEAARLFCQGQEFSWKTMEALLAAGPEALAFVSQVTAAAKKDKGFLDSSKGPAFLQREEIKILPPLTQPGKIVCVGLNYYDHCAEQGAKIPREPLLFAKFNTALTGPGDPIVRPLLTKELDYEAELTVVIGKKGKNISPAEALGFVAGYTIMNDVTARDLQFRDRQWVRSKTFDTFAPLGPFLVTAEEIPNPQSLAVRTWVNGELRQNSSTAQMIFSVAELIAFISQVVTLLPGDLIATGTPAGVGAFRKPPGFLAPGDIVRIEIQSLGALQNPVFCGREFFGIINCKN